MGCKTVAVGQVDGFIEFARNGSERRVPLLNAPAGKGERGGQPERSMCCREVKGLNSVLGEVSFPAAIKPRVDVGELKKWKYIVR